MGVNIIVQSMSQPFNSPCKISRMSSPQALPSCSLVLLCHSSLSAVTSSLTAGYPETRYAARFAFGLCSIEKSACKGGNICPELSRVCTSLCRMSDRPSSNWSPRSWVLALYLAWLWTRLASASLQPPTATGLGAVLRLERGLSRLSGELEGTLAHSTKQADLQGWSKFCRSKSSGYYPGISVLC